MRDGEGLKAGYMVVAEEGGGGGFSWDVALANSEGDWKNTNDGEEETSP